MLPPEAGDASYKADFDLFIWSWYETVEPNTLLQVFLCDQIGSSSDSLWCNPEYDKLYEQQNLAADDQARKVIIDQMQQLFYDQAPYHILYYDDELDAYRTDRFGGWQNQPLDGGYPLFSYSVVNYQFLTDAKATPPPTEAAAGSPGTSEGAATPAPAASSEGNPTGSSSSGPDSTVLALVAVVVVVVVAGGLLMSRRRRSAADEE